MFLSFQQLYRRCSDAGRIRDEEIPGDNGDIHGLPTGLTVPTLERGNDQKVGWL